MPKKLPIFYSALLLTGVNLLLRMVGTSFQVYLSSRIGAEGIGLLQLVMSVGSMALVAGMAGIRTATMYLTAEQIGKKHPENISWVLSGCFLYSIICSALVGGAVYIFAPIIAHNWIGNPETLSSLRLFAAFLPVNCLTGVMVGYFTGANRIGTLAAVEVAEQFCCMVCTIALLSFWAGHDAARSCQAVVMGSAMGACLTLISLVILRIAEHPKPARRLPVTRQLTQTAIPLALADDLRTGITTVENLMVPKRLALYSGVLSPLAAFGTVCGMVFPILTFPMAILFGLTELLIPELARCRAAGSTQRIHYLVQKSLRIALLFGTMCGGILFLCAKDLCQVLYKSEEAGTYLRWFSLLAVMLYCDCITDAMIKGLGEQKASVRYNILTNTMDVAFLYVLLPKYGILGYFISFLVTHIVNFYLSLRRLLRITSQKIPCHIPLLTLSAAAISITACLFVTGAILRSISYCVMLLCLLFLMGILGKDDIRWIKGLIYKK